MRVIASVLLVGLSCSPCRAVFLTGVDPGDAANWVPVRIEVPSAFDPISFVEARSINTDPADGLIGGAILPTAPYPFWLKRSANPFSSHPTWWLEIGITLNGSAIGGFNQFLLERDEAMAQEIVLRPKPEIYPPGVPPNDRVVPARLWSVDDGTPRDALAIMQFVPEPSGAALALMALAKKLFWNRSSLTRQPGRD
jgi:hypothetical protein